MNNSKPYYQRALLPFLSIMVATMACFCASSPSEACFATYSDSAKIEECITYTTAQCGNYNGSGMDVQSTMAHRDCVYAAAQNMSSQALNSSGGACATFRLTSPLDGMFNGVNTFYWDPYQGATGYRIEVYESGSLRATFNTDSSQTSLTADMSAATVGQGVMFMIRALAFVGPSVACTNDTMIIRGAPLGQPGGTNNIVAPPLFSVTPTTSGPVCGDGNCATIELSGDGYCAVDCSPG